MERELQRLEHSTACDVPAEYIIFDKQRNVMMNVVREVELELGKKAFVTMPAREQINQLVMQFTDDSRYEILTLFPIIARWFRGRKQGDDGLEEAFDAIQALGAYAHDARLASGMTARQYEITTISPYFDVAQIAIRVRENREYLSIARAESRLRQVVISDRVRAISFDLDTNAANSNFTIPARPNELEFFESLVLDIDLPFVALFYYPPNSRQREVKTRMHAASTQRDVTLWSDLVAEKLSKKDNDFEKHALVLALVRYRKILQDEQERINARHGINSTEQEIGDEEQAIREEAEEENLPIAKVSRRRAAEAEEAYAKFTYDGHLFSLKVPDDILDNRSRKVLEQFAFGRVGAAPNTQPTLVSIKAAFEVFDVAIGDRPALLIHCIATDPYLGALFYVNEAQMSTGEKQRLSMYYDAGQNRRAMITFSALQASKPADAFKKSGRVVGFNNRRYFRVNLSKVTSHETAVEVREMLLKLFTIYLEREDAMIATYKKFFKADLQPPEHDEEERPLSLLDRAKLVSAKFRGMGRSHQARSQPEPIATWEELHPDEESELIYGKERVEKRRIAAEQRLREATSKKTDKGEPVDVLLYDGVFWTSPHPNQPYLGFKQLLTTRFIKLPSCFSKPRAEVAERELVHPHEELPGLFRVKDENKPLKIQEDEPKKPKTRPKPITTMKILGPDGLGILTGSMGAILSRYNVQRLDQVAGDRVYLRMGVPFTADALIHAACVALYLDTKGEYRLLDYKGREEYVKKVRKEELVKYATCCRQELYDMTTEEIIMEISGNVWLDPKKYYRAVEEWMSDKEKRRSGKTKTFKLFILERTETQGMIVAVPRHKLMHVRDYIGGEDVVCVLLFVHRGQECNNAAHDQTELIISDIRIARTKAPKFTFESPVLYKKLLEMLKGNTVVRRIEHAEVLNTPNISLVSSPHDVLSVQRLFAPLQVVAQQIDSFGKLRAVRLVSAVSAVSGDSGDSGVEDITITVTTGPLAPICVREENLIIVRNKYEDVISLLQQLRQLEGDIVGSMKTKEYRAIHAYLVGLVDPITCLVFPVTIENVEIPVQEVRGVSFYDPRIEESGVSELSKLQQLKRAVTRILRHVEQAYVRSRENDIMPSGVDLIKQVCVVREGFEYDRPAIEENRAIIDSQAAYDWLVRYTDEFLARGRRLPLNTLAPPIVGIGKYVLNVPTTDMLQELEEYLLYHEPVLRDSFDTTALNQTEQPYLFVIEDELFCIQMIDRHTREGTRKTTRDVALSCAYNWQVFKVNTGFRTLLSNEMQLGEEEESVIKLGDTILPVINVVSNDVSSTLRVVKILEIVPGDSSDAPVEKGVLWGALLSFGRV